MSLFAILVDIFITARAGRRRSRQCPRFCPCAAEVASLRAQLAAQPQPFTREDHRRTHSPDAQEF